MASTAGPGEQRAERNGRPGTGRFLIGGNLGLLGGAEMWRFCSGRSVTSSIQTTDQHRPIAAMMTKDTRQPQVNAMKPTTGPASAPPSGVPAFAHPTAVACWRRGNQLLTSLLAADP